MTRALLVIRFAISMSIPQSFAARVIVGRVSILRETPSRKIFSKTAKRFVCFYLMYMEDGAFPETYRFPAMADAL